jgi:hypothetical protein
MRIPLLFIADGPERRICAGCLVVTTEVALDKVAFLEGVLDWETMVVVRHLDYLVEADMVELASLLLVDPVDRRDKFTVAVPSCPLPIDCGPWPRPWV